MDKEMLEAMRAIITENNQTLKQEFREEMSEMMDAKLEPIKTDMAGLKMDVAGLKMDVTGLKADVAEIKANQARTDERIEKLEVNQEYALKWLDRMDQRLNPVADYFETMNDLMQARAEKIRAEAGK